jgi:hypothetical protein
VGTELAGDTERLVGSTEHSAELGEYISDMSQTLTTVTFYPLAFTSLSRVARN